MSGKYQVYPEYVYSGLAWLGEMPSHWKLRKSKYLFKRMKRGIRSEDGVITAFRDGQVTLRTKRRTDGFTQSVKEIGYQGVRVGDLLVHAMDGFAGAIGVSDSDGKCSPVCSVCISSNQGQIYMPYYGYLVRQLAVTDFITSLAKGIRERSTEFRYSEFSSLDLVLPPIEEQQKIANFLDHETAKIDTLIEKQQRLIKLLKEKRQAVISHAVTKGLSSLKGSQCPMRDSGVEWLGEVPEHWEIKKLKHVVNEPLMYGANEAALDVNPENPRFVRITDVKDDGLLKDDTFRSLSEELAEPYLLSDGDILLARTGGTVGKSFMYSETWGRCCFAGYLIKASLDQNKVKAEWLYQYTKTQYYWEWIASSQIQATLPNVSADKYNGFLMAVPPIDEQIEILNKLRLEVVRFNELVSKAQNAIGLMQERRTALISAAVTGKIDVRNRVAPAHPCAHDISASLHVTTPESSNQQSDNREVTT